MLEGMKEDKGNESSDGEDSPMNLDDPDSAGFARGRGRTDVTMSFKGTPSFMAPEALLQQGAGLPADIWGVGCTVLEMVTGRAPWVGGGGSHGEGSSGGEFGDSHGSSGTAGGGGGSHGSNTVTKEGQPGKHGRRFSNIFGLVNFMNSSERAAPSVPDSLDIELKGFLDRCFEWDPDHRARVGELLRHAFVDEEEDLYGSSGIESPASGTSRGSKSVFSGEPPSSPVHVYVPGGETDQGSGGDPSSSSHGPIPTLPSKRTTNQTIQLARLRSSSATSDSGVHTPGSLIVNAHRMSNFSGYTQDSGLGSSRGSIKTHRSNQSSQSSRSRKSGRDSIRSGCSTNSSHSASGDNSTSTNSNELAAVAETEEEEEDEDEDEDENDTGKWDAGAEDGGGGGGVRSGDDEDGEFGDTSSENGSSKHGEGEGGGGSSDESSNYTDEATPLVVSPLGANDNPRRGRMPVRKITATEAHRFLALSPKGVKFNVRTAAQSGGGHTYTRRRSSSNPTTPSAKNQTTSAKNQTPDSLLKSLLRHNSLKSLNSEAEEADEAENDHATETDSGQSHDDDASSPPLSPAEMIQITKRKANEHRRSILPWLHARTGKAVAGRHTRSTLSLLRLLEEEKEEIAGGEAAAADKVTGNDAPNPFARGGVFAGAKGVSVANVKVAQQATVNATKESQGQQRRTKSTATRGKKGKRTGRSSGSKEAPQEAAKVNGDNSSSSNPFGRGGAFTGARGVVVAARGGEGGGGGDLPQ